MTVNALDEDDPGNPENKIRTRESQKQLRKIFMEWDLLGVSGAPEAADEYDCMLSPLMHMLHDGASEAKVETWLIEEVQRHFGSRSEPQRESRLAHQIVEWWRVRTLTP